MRVFLCVDDGGGMLFHNRRQSRDRILIEKVKEIVQDNKLWITEFSKELFCDNECVLIDPEILDKADEEDFCFVENLELYSHIDKVSAIYLFKWNRKYPSDVRMDFCTKDYFKLVRSEDFSGSSHEKITLEVWEKR